MPEHEHVLEFARRWHPYVDEAAEEILVEFGMSWPDTSTRSIVPSPPPPPRRRTGP